MNYAFTDFPEGYWRLDGSVLPNAAAAIPQFVKKLNTINNQMTGQKLIVGIDEWNQTFAAYGSCGKFAWQGSGLKFPAVNCFIRGLSDLTQLSQFVDDTMRPITGSVWGSNAKGMQYPSSNGAFTIGTMWQTHNGTSRDGRTTLSSFTLNSALLGSHYSGSETQPKHIKYPYIISVYNKIQNASEIVLNEVIESSVNKANISLDNLSEAGLNKIRNSVITSWSRNGNGYNRLSNGLIIQWGWNQINTNQSIPISFAIPFSDTYYRVVVTPFTSANAAGNKRAYYWADIYTTTSFNIFASFEQTGTATFTWIAIGF